MAYGIQKGVPLIETRGGSKPRPYKYPFRDMQIGDSFLVPGAGKDHPVFGSASQAGKRLEMKFTVRTVEDGVRVWRKE